MRLIGLRMLPYSVTDSFVSSERQNANKLA